MHVGAIHGGVRSVFFGTKKKPKQNSGLGEGVFGKLYIKYLRGVCVSSFFLVKDLS